MQRLCKSQAKNENNYFDILSLLIQPVMSLYFKVDLFIIKANAIAPTMGSAFK